MRELVTTLLDALGLLAVAGGAGVFASQWIGWAGLAVAGVVVLAGVRLADLLDEPGGEQ
jgi:hypothetical protein